MWIFFAAMFCCSNTSGGYKNDERIRPQEYYYLPSGLLSSDSEDSADQDATFYDCTKRDFPNRQKMIVDHFNPKNFQIYNESEEKGRLNEIFEGETDDNDNFQKMSKEATIGFFLGESMRERKFSPIKSGKENKNCQKDLKNTPKILERTQGNNNFELPNDRLTQPKKYYHCGKDLMLLHPSNIFYGAYDLVDIEFDRFRLIQKNTRLKCSLAKYFSSREISRDHLNFLGIQEYEAILNLICAFNYDSFYDFSLFVSSLAFFTEYFKFFEINKEDINPFDLFSQSKKKSNIYGLKSIQHSFIIWETQIKQKSKAQNFDLLANYFFKGTDFSEFSQLSNREKAFVLCHRNCYLEIHYVLIQ